MAFKLDVENMSIDNNICTMQLNKDENPFITITCYKNKMSNVIDMVSNLNGHALLKKSYSNVMVLMESLPGFNELFTEADKLNFLKLKEFLNE